MKKHIITAISLISASALLVLALGCTSTTAQTKNEQDLLIAAGFKVLTPKNAAQQQKLQSLPPGHLAMITKGGQTYYVFPDAANNRALVGGPKQYQSYQRSRIWLLLGPRASFASPQAARKRPSDPPPRLCTQSVDSLTSKPAS